MSDTKDLSMYERRRCDALGCRGADVAVALCRRCEHLLCERHRGECSCTWSDETTPDVVALVDDRAEAERLRAQQRPGQAVFNALARVDADFAERVRGTELDPFHDDARIAGMLAWWRDALTGVEDAAEGWSARAMVVQREAVEAEREACAKLCDEIEASCRKMERGHAAVGRDSSAAEAWEMAGVAEDCAEAIRARGTDGAA